MIVDAVLPDAACHFALEEAARRLDPEQRLATLVDSAAATIELYMPRGYDGQTPHDRDESYVVAAGHGRFTCGDHSRDVAPGDLIHVPAGVPHRFDHFDPGFAVWVMFHGPRAMPGSTQAITASDPVP